MDYIHVQELMIAALSHLDAASKNVRSAYRADCSHDDKSAAEFRAIYLLHVKSAVALLAAIESGSPVSEFQGVFHSSKPISPSERMRVSPQYIHAISAYLPLAYGNRRPAIIRKPMSRVSANRLTRCSHGALPWAAVDDAASLHKQLSYKKSRAYLLPAVRQ